MNLPWKILLIGVTLQACFDLGLSEENNALEGAENLPDTRRLLKPQFIEFTRYIQVFNKHYASMKETVVRRLIYLGRAMQAFISSIQYKSRKSSYYLKVNQMSDWTKDETSKMFMTTEGNINLDDDIDEDDTDEEDELDEMEDRVERTKRDVEETKGGEEEQKLPDKVYVDHRQSPCYKPPKSQKKCGSCWVFSSIALYEWLYCKSKGEYVSLSEQFILDCGKIIGLSGCGGGHYKEVNLFVEKYGLDYEENYPYKGKEDECKLKENQVKRKICVEGGRSKGVKLDQLEKYLEKSPIYISLKVGLSFNFYGGGVDSGEGERENGHAMLMIGHGIEDSQEYYLFRNSYSTWWGEEGHYKLSKQAKHLIKYDKGYILKGKIIEGDCPTMLQSLLKWPKKFMNISGRKKVKHDNLDDKQTKP